ncbi:hypothetical protein GCM10012286_34350 [Streptomyces lasiicapitis]|uniref:DinB family protein n=1 Tax=Streptomyces lasiicapitis TaxID=1923961 RepID=A0ABQ2M062_9ACTN|nr:hypothetical protein GCM10012286_34350 [Streptomyces lasiicapitis]
MDVRREVPTNNGGRGQKGAPIGLVKHLAAVEYGWFCETFARAAEPLWFDPETQDMTVADDETIESLVAFYTRARAAADRAISETGLEDLGKAWDGRQVTMRWVLIHMLEETARHAGHMDIVRELIDGAAGDHREYADN